MWFIISLALTELGYVSSQGSDLNHFIMVMFTLDTDYTLHKQTMMNFIILKNHFTMIK